MAGVRTRRVYKKIWDPLFIFATVEASSGVATGGTCPRTSPKDRLWDSSRSDEKLVRLGGDTTQCLDNFGILGRYITVSYLHTNF